MNRRAVAEIAHVSLATGAKSTPLTGSLFEQTFIQQFVRAVRPEVKALIRELMGEAAMPLVVDYEEAGRMIGTTYEGIRKLVQKGKLGAVSRSGRCRGVAVQELRDYVQRNQVMPE